MRNALFTWSPFTRNKSENNITPSSQAYSTSRLLAMMRKFWLDEARRMPMMTAKVIVVVAKITQVRFFLNSSVSRRLGTR